MALENAGWSWKIIGKLRKQGVKNFVQKLKKTVLTYFSLNKIIGKLRKNHLKISRKKINKIKR